MSTTCCRVCLSPIKPYESCIPLYHRLATNPRFLCEHIFHADCSKKILNLLDKNRPFPCIYAVLTNPLRKRTYSEITDFQEEVPYKKRAITPITTSPPTPLSHSAREVTTQISLAACKIIIGVGIVATLKGSRLLSNGTMLALTFDIAYLAYCIFAKNHTIPASQLKWNTLPRIGIYALGLFTAKIIDT